MGGGGENAWLSTARFKIETQCGCFYITVFLMETNCFQRNIFLVVLNGSVFFMLSTRAFFSRRQELKNVQLWVKLSAHHCHFLVS